MKTTLQKTNLLVTIIGAMIFLVCSILQAQIFNQGLDVNVELNQLTVIGMIILSLTIIAWLVFFNHYIFSDGWNWIQTKTKFDDFFAIVIFTILVPFLLSFLCFVIYNLVVWFEWYTLSVNEPLYRVILKDTINELGRELIFGIMLISLVSLSSGLAIFLYKLKSKKVDEAVVETEDLMKENQMKSGRNYH